MSEIKNWVREYELVFSGPTKKIVISSIDQINPLDIAFDVGVDPANFNQATLSLSVYGLSESNINILHSPGVKVWLKVGYRGLDRQSTPELTTLFSGTIRELEVSSSPTSHETKIKAINSKAGSRAIAVTLTEGVTHFVRILEYIRAMKVSVPELIISRTEKDLVEMLESELDSSKIQARKLDGRVSLNDLVVGGLTVMDTSLAGLQKMLDTFNIRALITNDELRLVREGGFFRTDKVIQRTLGQNLLNPPTKKLENMKVPTDSPLASKVYEMEMLLTPELEVNGYVSTSHIRNDAGNVEEQLNVFQVSSLRHRGRYRGTEWYTEATGTLNEEFLTDAPIVSVLYDIQNPTLEPTEGSVGGALNVRTIA
jgi:hypothetical protein